MKKTLLVLSLLFCLLPFTAFCEAEKTPLFPAQGENGMMGYIDASGQWAIPPQFDAAADFRGDYACVFVYPEGVQPETGDYWETPDYYGIIDRAGEFVLPPEYHIVSGQSGDYFGGKDTGVYLVYRVGDYVWGEDEEGEEILIQRPRMGFFDIPSGCFSGLQWQAVWHWCSDSDLIPVIGENYLAGYADRSTGEMVIPCQYFSTDPSSFLEGVAAVAYEDAEGNPLSFFLIDETGAEIPLPEGIHARYAGGASDGRVPVENEQGLLGFADLRGNVVIPPQFLMIHDFQDGYALVRFPEEDWGLIDRDGNVASRGYLDAGYWGPKYKNGALVVEQNETTRVVYAVTGEKLFSLAFDAPDFQLRPPMENGLCWFYEYQKGVGYLGGLVNLRGEIVSEAQWLLSDFEPTTFPDGLQLVKRDGKWGYIDETGSVAIPLIYDSADSFENGLAWVRLGSRSGYIDASGSEVFFWETEE